MNIVGLSDMVHHVALPQNFDQEVLEVQVAKAQRFDLEPRIGREIVEDMKGLLENRPELEDFREVYVKPLLAHRAYERILTVHGRNVTPAGIVKPSDPEGTFESANKQDRKELLQLAERDAAVHETEMWNELRRANFTFDGVSYEIEEMKDRRRRNFRISGI